MMRTNHCRKNQHGAPGFGAERTISSETKSRFLNSSARSEKPKGFSGFFQLVLAFLLLIPLGCPSAFAGTGGTISGVVKDPSGAVVVSAKVVARNSGTGISYAASTDSAGFYSFSDLPVGQYTIEVTQQGFKHHLVKGLTIDANSALRVDVTLEIGTAQETVTVSSAAVQVETVNTQMGEVITGSSMTSIPLNGRSFTDLLALQPGVVPESTGEYGAGFSPSGDLNPGNLSVSGQRESANGFMVNGGNVEEGGNMGTAVIPNLDSIAEFRILTNNFDAEYGNYMGGLVNVVTKSGTNEIHGDAFEFVRNTDFDAANFFASGQRGVYHRNQFGGTLGAPILHNKLFFFGDYQGTRQVVGQTTTIPVPSDQDRSGNLSDISSTLTGSVSGPAWAQILTNKLGYPVSQGEPYFTQGCTASSQCVFPNAVIPTTAWSAPSQALLQYIPHQTDLAQGTFSSSAFNQTLRDDKFGERVDANTRWGMLSVYYFYDDFSLVSPYQSASVPGFATTTLGRSQQANFGDTKTFGSSVVNEFRLNYTRLATRPTPTGGVNPSLTPNSLGFLPASQGGIAAQAPNLVGVPSVGLNNFSFGVNPFTEDQINNTYQVLDNFSKTLGTHTIKLGVSAHLSQINIFDRGANNGTFSFNGGETGSDFADFLLGAPVVYLQGVQVPMYTTSRYYGLYGQDSWRVSKNLTFNYGLRWEVTTPWYEKHNEIETIVPGLQSIVFPGAPTGWVFPGDPGIPRTLGPTRYHNFGPRIGLAYSPSSGGGIARALFGAPGSSSIRIGYGIFYTAFEDATSFNEVGDAPYGFFYVSPAPPLFAAPFVDLGDGINQGQRFPVPFPPLNVGPSNPDNNVNWSQFLPIASSPGFYYRNRVPYSENYMVSVQRQFGANTVLTVSYVGTQGHRLLADLNSNPANPALCLFLSDPANVDTTVSSACGPFGEDSMYVLNPGVTPPAGAFSFTGTVGNDTCPAGRNCVAGTRRVINPAFLGSNGYFITMANSGYNALEVSLRHSSQRAAMLLAYTYGKAMDNASSWGPGVGDAAEEINPVNPRLSRSLSAFDLTHNFVVSYSYELPFDKILPANRLTSGWTITGITRYSTGLPVTLNEQDDNSLLGTNSTGPTSSVVDTPNFTPGPLNFTNPRSGQPYFNISLFTPEATGQLGNANRRFFHGPGIANWVFGLLKDVHLTESKRLEFRAEFFNIFNHAQFNLPNGDIISSDFGKIHSAREPRIGQLAMKLLF